MNKNTFDAKLKWKYFYFILEVIKHTIRVKTLEALGDVTLLGNEEQKVVKFWILEYNIEFAMRTLPVLTLTSGLCVTLVMGMEMVNLEILRRAEITITDHRAFECYTVSDSALSPKLWLWSWSMVNENKKNETSTL